MKRVAVAAVLLVAAVAVSVWSGKVFESNLTALSDELDRLIDISETAEDEELMRETEKVLEGWKSSSKLLHSLVLHEGMDELEQNITALPLIIEHSDRERFRLSCIEGVNQIKNLLNSEKISIENIL